ncbi:phenylalanine--tRNA ligase subunit beta [Candidatus Kaiserbacteria bacterium]|nr:phenylalanine--tRNA ligase subunit beta [Candidatus Kaiserbacteria bacterium]
MKISRGWLQKYFGTALPSVAEIAEAFTFHAFEIEESTDDTSTALSAGMLDVKVLPNRAADCFCHRGIARELSAILDLPLKQDPLRESLPEYGGLRNTHLKIEIETPEKCSRYVGALVRGVKVRPSPDWLRKALESVGQRSINNIVDATNYVMLNIGQPLHAFDTGRLKLEAGGWKIGIRNAKPGEKITTLSNENYELTPNILLITDANADAPIALAGIKGGKAAEISEATTDIIIESANFDGTTTRKSAQSLKLFTDASARFQNRPSPELCAYGMRDVLALIIEVAGGEIMGVVDEYPVHPEQRRGAEKPEPRRVSVTLEKINGVLGSAFSRDEVEGVFKRLDLPAVCEGQTFTITAPFERTDLNIPEDLIEEVGRILGYDRIPATELPALSGKPDQARYRGIEKVKDFLVERGFTEISTQSFARKGDIELANPLDKTKPALRTNLSENMQEALKQAKHYAPLVLSPNEKPKLFEIGTVFQKEGERLVVETSEPVPDLPPIQEDPNYTPLAERLGAFKPYSNYPFIARDIAFWSPSEANDGHPMSIIREIAGDLLTRLDLFDQFEKNGRTSFAYRLVFQSFDRTLTDAEANDIMARISTALAANGFEVR